MAEPAGSKWLGTFDTHPAFATRRAQSSPQFLMSVFDARATVAERDGRCCPVQDPHGVGLGSAVASGRNGEERLVSSRDVERPLLTSSKRRFAAAASSWVSVEMVII